MDEKKPAPAVKPAAHAAAAKAMPSHIILTADYAGYLAGKVLPADADLLAQLDAEHAGYREATARERGLAGFPA